MGMFGPIEWCQPWNRKKSFLAQKEGLNEEQQVTRTSVPIEDIVLQPPCHICK
jgi:hypothetical protein